ncbi:MAG: class I SAM-dependent methyltransferase [Candidatus Moranbacteria bacterium]|nr:class I SAM-dependent methyltransferase [Candidatus Moranbacteria bacterium]
MQNLPTAEVYEKEFRYMPWGILIHEIMDRIAEDVPQEGKVLDLLCGTGYLLSELKKRRPDISFVGVDMESEFIDFAMERYDSIEFKAADVLKWTDDRRFDAVLCTAGLHHLPYEMQDAFVGKVAGFVGEGGFAIIADPYIDDYADEIERKLASAKLGYEYLAATIRNGGTDDVIDAALTLIGNDIYTVEFKTSVAKNRPVFSRYFGKVEEHKTWPETDGGGYGDYYFILRR